ncbi:UMP kinase [Actinobacillus pleuropneumoniae]|uniref:Uridylate kinase n=1 Tax=Actinobacillus pleuropneumoniae serotype 5b (strain L20) TaxID=416269 RepID=PYRH_ACTP2|nr:UMP kinase [Actinobacillus pleuropneumoniae]A3MZT5.1 RecName: Full=Uridylate kinase; Short=UK; AltName: Full=Uridine monophosphate kinase; Short=UMP kinase; Short=UMPK [Actinobacillus pleuropneumoniae serovar 5b str. L20]ABN73671.1 uridylate kinase [Actinobacillus pleuropneumoniae serovar 5b str. L20]MEE3682445.1 UMP kinase [Actinobacillus pleuropneumoniae]UKH11208.1 UMP kinase [Actinobacillus pleuropneumoniae]UPK79203.1 UMP kinase [Actinobacillus pleuropneumoniae]VTR50426.1 uridylate kina
MSNPIYKRILLKLSGEALQGDEGFGIDPSILDRMALEIKELIEMGVEVGVVLGGGNLFRGAKLAKAGMNRVVGDHMGMLATVMNGLAMRDALHRADVNAKLMSAFQLNGICDTYNWSEAIKMLREKRVVIFSAGTGSPFFTTDSAACLRGIEIEADIVLKATKVDGVYDKDPAKFADAKLYNQLTYAEVIEQELQVMDLAAFTLARDHGMPIRVFNMVKPGALKQVITGTAEGTIIS